VKIDIQAIRKSIPHIDRVLKLYTIGAFNDMDIIYLTGASGTLKSRLLQHILEETEYVHLSSYDIEFESRLYKTLATRRLHADKRNVLLNIDHFDCRFVANILDLTKLNKLYLYSSCDLNLGVQSIRCFPLGRKNTHALVKQCLQKTPWKYTADIGRFIYHATDGNPYKIIHLAQLLKSNRTFAEGRRMLSMNKADVQHIFEAIANPEASFKSLSKAMQKSFDAHSWEEIKQTMLATFEEALLDAEEEELVHEQMFNLFYNFNPRNKLELIASLMQLKHKVLLFSQEQGNVQS